MWYFWKKSKYWNAYQAKKKIFIESLKKWLTISNIRDIISISNEGGVNMIKGTPGEWYSDNYIGGYFNQNGELVVCEEYDLSDSDSDKYSVEVQNGDGYYSESGKYVSFGRE